VLKPYHTQMVSTIRQHSQNVIVMGTRTWSQEVDEAASDPVQGDNLAYSLHFYVGTHKQDLRNKAAAALSRGVCVFASEWGIWSQGGGPAVDYGEARAWNDFLAQNGISSANWAINDKAEPASALKPGASSHGSWSDGELTEAGRLVRDELRKGSGPTPGLTTTTTPAPAPDAVAPAGSPVAAHGHLRVSGGRLLDGAGQPVRLQGMSLFWSQWSGRFWNADVLRWLRDDWKVSLVRAAMGVEAGGYLQNPEAEMARVETVVNAAVELGLYVLVDWHDHHAEQHRAEAQGFFEKVAKRYGRLPNVLFETFNEPEHQGWSQVLKPYHTQMVSTIRQHSQNVIVMGTRTWSQEVDEAASDPVQGDNLAYSLHFYVGTHKQDLRNKAAAALSRGVCVFASEWGIWSQGGGPAVDYGEARAWNDFLAQNGISSANWAINDKAEPASALKPGASSHGSWSDGELTEAGRLVRDELRKGSGPTPGLTTTTTPAPAPDAGGFCCWWPQNRPAEELCRTCISKTVGQPREWCKGAGTWCGGDTVRISSTADTYVLSRGHPRTTLGRLAVFGVAFVFFLP